MKKEWIFLSVIAIGILSFLLDNEIVLFVHSLKNFLLDEIFYGISFVSSSIIIFFVITTLFLVKEHKRKFVIPLWISVALSVVISFLMKVIFERLRPYQERLVEAQSVFIQNSHTIWDFSFPSFHAMLVFASLPFISKEFPKLKYFWFVLAILVGLSRVYFGLHFLSDVIFGGLIGYSIGFLVLKTFEKRIFVKK